jgi:hypothetical protein
LEITVDKAAASGIEAQVRSAFPEGSIQEVQVLAYGDDPEIEPGQSAIRIVLDHTPRPEVESGRGALHRFRTHNAEAVNRLRHELPFIGWIEFRLGGKDPTDGHGPRLRTSGEQRDSGPGELTSVMARLGQVDLATVDTLITAGIATSRAEVLRWALGRIRENPAYAQIQDRVREISELKAQF